MSTTAYEQRERIAEIVVREPIDNTRASWVNRVRSADHKVIGTTMIGFSLIMLVIAGFSELLTWAQLALPDNTFLSPERFYSLHTLADTSYLYFFALPLFAGLATYVLPLQIGARGSAFPRLSALGAWMIVFGGGLLLFSTFLSTWQGGVQVSYSLASFFYSPGPGVDFWFVSAILVGGGLACNAVDLAVTYKSLRAPGMDRETAPIFSYATAVYAYGVIATAPVLVGACLMALLEREWGVFGIFDPVNGGSALLWKTLFQWWSHAAPYLTVVLAAGVASEIVAAAARTPIVSNAAVKRALSLYMVFAILGFGQAFFGAPVGRGWLFLGGLASMLLFVPSAMLISSWIQTIKRGDFTKSAPATYALVFIGFFTFGMVANLGMSLPELGAWLGGSAFGYAVWQNLVWATAAFGGFAGLVYWYPKITGRNLDAGKAKLALWMMAAGTAVAILSSCSLGVDGFARELSTYNGGYQARNIEAGLGTLLAAFGAIGLLINFIQSRARGAKAGNDPWHGGTLEWYAPSPPPANNFDVVPLVDSELPLEELRRRVARKTGELAGSVAQSPTAGRPSLRESKH